MDTFVKRLQPENYELWLKKNYTDCSKNGSLTLEAPLTRKSNILSNKK